MWSPIVLVLGLFLCCVSAWNCPLYGPTFPKLQNPANSSIIQATLKNLTALFDAIDADSSTGSGNNSYTVQIFSISDQYPILFEHYHTSPNLTNQNSTGVQTVDGDTVFRLGSVTKIWTILTWLSEAGDSYFLDPVTKHVPELAALAGNTSGNAISRVAWEDITIGELASQMAGISNDNTLLGELTITAGFNASANGFPAEPAPPCGIYPLPECDRAQFFETFSKFYPAFAPAETPSYSNIAFQIISYALESITGKPYNQSLTDTINRLNLTHTFLEAPDASLGVIPGNIYDTEWYISLGEELPAGGMLSSVNDMSSLGRSIMKSSLISPAMTRRWLKPATFTSDPRETVGYPWGIRRMTLDSNQPYDFLTAYIKAGSIGSYTSLLGLLPEYGIGWSVLVAGDKRLNNFGIAEISADQLLPAMAQAVREEAQQIYGGHYTAPNTNSSTNSNSSLTIDTDPAQLGLGISSWISNGVDMRMVYSGLALGSQSSQFTLRLYPTELQNVAADGSKEWLFKAVPEDLGAHGSDGTTFTAACGTWIGPSAFVYSSQALDSFVFAIDKDGKVVSVQPLALRETLNKVG